MKYFNFKMLKYLHRFKYILTCSFMMRGRDSVIGWTRMRER